MPPVTFEVPTGAALKIEPSIAVTKAARTRAAPILKTAAPRTAPAPRTGLYSPLFAATSLAKAQAAERLSDPRPDFKSPGQPRTPAALTSPESTYRRSPGLADASAVRHLAQCQQSAAGHAALLDSIKAALAPKPRPAAGPVAV